MLLANLDQIPFTFPEALVQIIKPIDLVEKDQFFDIFGSKLIKDTDLKKNQNKNLHW